MPAAQNLTAIAGAKAILCARIAAQREAIADATHEVTRPLALLDPWLGLWRALPPIVRITGVAVGGLVAGRCLRSPSLRGTLWQWLPVLFAALRR